ncbi:cystatin-like [Bufo gargarizans]|uniref:cystatin-like n=1 Tax=Bufo gargarizans TaxID=30331 RepID=UPI001CF3D3AC|nr:cystatin-like [Bufo gargarizans]
MMSAGLCSRALVALSLLSVYVYGDIFAGGLQWQDPSDPYVVKAATFAVREYNKLPNEVYDYKLMKIVSAEAQVVAGVIYVLNVEIGRTDCKRASTSEKSSCDIIQDPKLAKTLLCEFAVLEVPWENVESLLSSFCRTLQ